MISKTHSPRERFNWGYWDGRNDQERNKRPEWSKSCRVDLCHPFDSLYGKGYWAGRNDEARPDSSNTAWNNH